MPGMAAIPKFESSGHTTSRGRLFGERGRNKEEEQIIMCINMIEYMENHMHTTLMIYICIFAVLQSIITLSTRLEREKNRCCGWKGGAEAKSHDGNYTIMCSYVDTTWL